MRLPTTSPCYQDSQVANGFLGYPKLVSLTNGDLLASTWSSVCLRLDPDNGQASPQPQIGAGPMPCFLQSPTASRAEPILCCAATRIVTTGLWSLDHPDTIPVNAGGAINAVALTPDGDLLATGLGWYPLDPHAVARAAVELHRANATATLIERRPLPGVAVDRVVFHPDAQVLAAVTGARSQDRGHVFLLRVPSLELLDVAETERAMCCAAFIDPVEEWLFTVHRRVIEARPLDRLDHVEWQWRAGERLMDAAYDPVRQLIVTSAGQVVSPFTEEQSGLPPLDECSGVAILRDGQVAGINGAGVLRVWDAQLTPERAMDGEDP